MIKNTDSIKREKLIKKRVVTYERVSTEDQLSALQNQHQWLLNLLDQHKTDWEIVRHYTDEAKSGTNIKKRDGFKEMLSDLLNDRIKADLIVTREFSRFARDGAGGINYTRKLAEKNIDVYFVDQNMYAMDQNTQLQLYIFAGIAEEESRRTSIRVKHGQEIAKQKGVIFGNDNILGYDKIRSNEKSERKFVINEDQAETVKLIFDMYVNKGMSLRTIAFELERIGRLSAKGTTIWSATVISGIIKNPRYAGYAIYNKSITTDFLSHNRKTNPEEEWIIVPTDQFDPIISKDLWDKAQEIRKGRQQHYTTNRGQKQPKHMYSKLLVCGVCGCHFNRRLWSNHGTEKRYGYVCNRQAHYGSEQTRKNKGMPKGKCDAMQVTEWKLDLVMREVFIRLKQFDPDEIIDETIKLLEKHIRTNDRDDITAKRKQLEKKHNEKQLKAKRLIDLYTDGKITEEHYEEAYDKIITEIKEIEKNLTRLKPDHLNNEANQKIERLKKIKNTLQTIRWDQASAKAPDHLIETMVEEIKVYSDRLDIMLRIKPDEAIKVSLRGKTKKAFEYNIDNQEEFGDLLSATDMALEQGREVFAVPGRATDRLSDGCNLLLKQGAAMATQASDIAESFFGVRDEADQEKRNPRMTLSDTERGLMEALDIHPKPAADIIDDPGVRASGKTPQELICALTELALRGLIEQEGNCFARRPA